MDTVDNKLSDTDESSNTDIYLLYLLDGKVLHVSFSSCGNISTHVTSTVGTSKMTRMEMLKKLKEES